MHNEPAEPLSERLQAAGVEISNLRSLLFAKEHGTREIAGVLRRVLENGLWRAFVDFSGAMHEHETFEDFVRSRAPLAGLGETPKALWRAVAHDRDARIALAKAFGYDKQVFVAARAELLAESLDAIAKADHPERVDALHRVQDRLDESLGLVPDSSGFVTLRRWGLWSLQIDAKGGLLLVLTDYYWISEDRFRESDWIEHVSRKNDPTHYDPNGLEEALAFVNGLDTKSRNAIRTCVRVLLPSEDTGDKI